MSTEISRREFLKLSGLAVSSLLIPPEIQDIKPLDNKKEAYFPFINQRNKSQCAIASMTMLIASYLERNGKTENINDIYNQVLTITTKTVGREISPDLKTGVFGNQIKEILNESSQKYGFKLIDNPRPYNPRKMASMLKENGPAIVDINVNYLNDDVNHWVVTVKIEEIENKSYAINIADPFRSSKRLPYLPLPSYTPKGMIFKPDGTIVIPWNTFSETAGNVFIQLTKIQPSTPGRCTSLTPVIINSKFKSQN